MSADPPPEEEQLPISKIEQLLTRTIRSTYDHAAELAERCCSYAHKPGDPLEHLGKRCADFWMLGGALCEACKAGALIRAKAALVTAVKLDRLPVSTAPVKKHPGDA